MVAMDAGGGIPEAISKAEERFDRARRSISLFLGPALFIALLLFPFPGLTPEAHKLLAVLGLVLTYWVGEPIPIPATALMGPALCVLLGVADSKTVFAPFAHPIIFLFIGSFMLAEGMKKHRLDYRISLWVLSRPWVGESYLRVFIAVALIPMFFSMWISDSATTAMVYPITVGICAMVDRLARGRGGRFNTGLLLVIAYSALIGGVGTPIGTPPNLIGVGMLDKLAGIKIPFFVWMQLAVPIMLCMVAGMIGYMFLIHRPPEREITGLSAFIAEKRRESGPWSPGQKITLAAFLLAVLLWVLPGLLALLLGAESGLYRFVDRHLHEEVVSLVAALVLFLAPVDWPRREFALSWKEAVHIDWGTILLFGGGLSLGGLMFSTKLADAFGTSIIETTGVHSLWGITAIATALAIIITEFTSNTATANMLVPLLISIASAAGINPLPPVVGACMGASMAFMLPVSTPSNAIVYGSGKVPISAMIRAGFVLDVVGFVVILAGLRILCPLLGLV